MWKTILVTVYLFVLSIYDIRERKVPLVWLVAGGVLVLLGGLYNGVTGMTLWLQQLLGVLPGLFLLVVAWVTQKAGYADGIVLILLGILEGYRLGVVLLCVSLLLLCCVVILLLCFRKVKKNTQMPYIPFLAGAYLLIGFT